MLDHSPFRLRPAGMADIPAMQDLIRRAGITLSTGFYSPAQAERITRLVYGVDTRLVVDRSYFVVEQGERLAACGGWSRHSTLHGGDQAKTAPERLLDPATEAARIRAFFVEPGLERRGLASMLLRHCADEAYVAGFRALELTATLPGEPLYRRFGFTPVAHHALDLDGVAVPVVHMRRPLPLDDSA